MTRAMAGIVFIAALAGCGGGKPEEKAAAPPEPKAADAPMPDVWKARFDTTQGGFTVEVTKAWAPQGAERFWKLVKSGFFDDTRFYRVRPGFIVQFGLSGDPNTTAIWNNSPIDDDPVKEKNVRGTVTFAQAGKRSRRTQVFINLKDNVALGRDGFAPFGRVVEGLEVVEKLYAGYGEWEPPGRGPNANRIQTQGNTYLDAQFPQLDRIRRAAVEQ